MYESVCIGERGREVGRKGVRKGWGGREWVEGKDEGTLHMRVGEGGWGGEATLYIPMSGNTISRFFEILKTVVDYLKRPSDKSVTTSVSQSLHRIVYCSRQQSNLL